MILDCFKVLKKRKQNRNPKSAATSNFILNVVVVMILAQQIRGYFQITF